MRAMHLIFLYEGIKLDAINYYWRTIQTYIWVSFTDVHPIDPVPYRTALHFSKQILEVQVNNAQVDTPETPPN
jgi:hypothetical protein